MPDSRAVKGKQLLQTVLALPRAGKNQHDLCAPEVRGRQLLLGKLCLKIRKKSKAFPVSSYNASGEPNVSSGSRKRTGISYGSTHVSVRQPHNCLLVLFLGTSRTEGVEQLQSHFLILHTSRFLLNSWLSFTEERSQKKV